MNRDFSYFSCLSIPFQLAASTLGVGLVGMKVGEYFGGAFWSAIGFLGGLVAGFFGYVAFMARRE